MQVGVQTEVEIQWYYWSLQNCLIVKGYSHTSRVHYFEAFVYVAKYDSIYTMLIFVVKNMELLQFNSCTIFLNGDLDEEIFMVQLEGFQVVRTKSKVCKIFKCLYDLCQASHAWNIKFNNFCFIISNPTLHIHVSTLTLFFLNWFWQLLLTMV